jgi:hypothetical protein
MPKRILLVALALVGSACATTKVEPEYAAIQRAPRPELILVHNFATTPDEVRLDHSLTAMTWKLEGLSASAEQQAVAKQVADKLADRLVEKIRALGIPAERAVGVPHDSMRIVVIDGMFLTIDEGSRTKRVVIGLGAGKSHVRTAVHTIELLPGGSRLLDTFEVDAKSDSTPGMAETMGVGAAAGHLAVSAAVSAGKAVASEELGADVDADALRTATKISEVLADYFAGQGWIPPRTK